MIVFQEEEESLAEGSKDEPAEQAKLREEGEAPMEDTSLPSPPEPKGSVALEGEKAENKENGDKSETQVSSRLDPEVKGADLCPLSLPLDPWLWR